MITLVIINCQSDYLTGTMCTKTSKNILPKVKDFIKDHKEEIAKIVFAIEWHPYNHCSFKKFGGKFPSHCVQYTPGACIEPKLLKYVQSLNIPYEVTLRGIYSELEESGAFTDVKYVKDYFGDRYYIDDALIDSSTEIVTCGIYIKDSINNLLESEIRFKVFSDGIYPLDEKIVKYIKEKEIEKV